MSDINRRRHISNRVCSFILFYFSNKTHANFLRWILYKIIKLNALDLIIIESEEDQCIKFVLLCYPNCSYYSCEMDIRSFFKNVIKSDDSDNNQLTHPRTHVEPAEQHRGGHQEQLLTATNQMPPRTPLAKVTNDLPHHLDIGSYVKPTEHLTNNRRYDLMMNTYVPPTDYSYQNDSQGSRFFPPHVDEPIFSMANILKSLERCFVQILCAVPSTSVPTSNG